MIIMRANHKNFQMVAQMAMVVLLLGTNTGMAQAQAPQISPAAATGGAQALKGSSAAVPRGGSGGGKEHVYSSMKSCRAHTASLADFGGVGDGKTSNTQAFVKAMEEMSKHQASGGSLLYIPPGKWLTGSFNITASHFTLFLDKEAIIVASQEEADYPIIEPLPSYGQGRDNEGPRFSSLIMGTKLQDIVITGNNGTIEGQGEPWWTKFKAKQLKYTRPYLVELMFCNDVMISNITLQNSPNWHIHPVYGSNMIFRGVTILAPVDVPNTDGINPDSVNNTIIEDCYIVSGDDCVAVKSGWDKFGIKFNMPTQQLVVRRLTCISPDSAVVALGSEMSGGISDVRIEDITAINTQSGVRIKTAKGRGAYVRDIYARNMVMNTMQRVFWMNGDYGSHPGNNFDVKDVPKIENIQYKNVVADNVTIAGDLNGMPNNAFSNICISNVTIKMGPHAKKVPWNCSQIAGVSSKVEPPICAPLHEKAGKECDFPTNKIPIEEVQLQTCTFKK